MNASRINALRNHLGSGDLEIEQSALDECLLSLGNQEYLVLTDDEANKRARDYILDSLWAFRPEFLVGYMPITSSDRVLKSFGKMQEELCEDANELIRALVDARIDELVSDAIGADGRGHFLSGYDGEENEEGDFFIYRVN